MRKHYLGHLTDVVMVSSTMYAAERLGGADFDGDMVKTIADPIVNRCVQKNYQYQNLDNLGNLPFLKIPSIQARVQDAKDWRARFQTVRDTFSSRVGQISNAALARSVIAYNENSQAEERQQAREEVETLAILTGLEIDSAKSGVKPDLSPYLGRSRKQKNLFLTYKYRMEGKTEKRKGAVLRQTGQGLPPLHRLGAGRRQPGAAALPGLAAGGAHSQAAGTLPARRGAVQLCPRPPVEREAAPGLPQAGGGNDPGVPAVPGPHPGQHGPCPGAAPPHGRGAHPVRPGPGGAGDGGGAVRRLLRPGAGTGDRPAGTNPGAGVAVPASWGAGELSPGTPTHRLVDEYGGLLCDFRAGGYRILGDLLLDVERENRLETSRQLHRAGDSEQMEEMLESYENKTAQESYREAAARGCRQYLERHIQPKLAVQCAAALGKRGFLWDVLLDAVLATARKEERRD